MFGLLPATLPREIRTGSWLEPEASTKERGTKRRAASLAAIAVALLLGAIAVALSPSSSATYAARPHLAWPLEIEGSQYVPVAWADIPGWNEDDHLPAFTAFRASCKPINAQNKPVADPKLADTKAPDAKALGTSLQDPCRAAKIANI